ncbi:MAG TPA: hypothetical protein VFT12_09965, partial [Thermoanaerobaculia bacterium]|nr:hypothetical protein [Thermoanaerobaculia bacterium]
MPEMLLAVVPLALVASVPLLLTVCGELVVQRSGMINLGIEGMLLAAAFGATVTGNIAGGIAGAMVIAALFGIFAISLRADQIVTGTALNLLALGLTAFIYREIDIAVPAQMKSDSIAPFAWIVMPLLIAVLLWRTTPGLRLRAAGENPAALRAAGRSAA